MAGDRKKDERCKAVIEEQLRLVIQGKAEKADVYNSSNVRKEVENYITHVHKISRSIIIL